MTVNDVVSWYGDNVNHKINNYAINRMIELGIVSEDINIKLLNSMLLEKKGEDFVKDENGKYVLKQNKASFIDSFIPKAKKVEEKKALEVRTNKQAPKANTHTKKFKIEKTGNKTLRLIKL